MQLKVQKITILQTIVFVSFALWTGTAGERPHFRGYTGNYNKQFIVQKTYLNPVLKIIIPFSSCPVMSPKRILLMNVNNF